MLIPGMQHYLCDHAEEGGHGHVMSITRARLRTISNRKSTVEVATFSRLLLCKTVKVKVPSNSFYSEESYNPAIPGDPIGP